MGSETYWVVISPVLECIIEMDIFGSWNNLYWVFV